MIRFIPLLIALSAVCGAHAQTGSSPIPSFTATALSGQKVSSDKLIGQPTLLIVTPSTDAAEDTRLWVKALRENIDIDAVRIRDVLAVNLPFFMSEADAIGRAKEKIPARYYDQTWIFAQKDLELALDIPTDSAKAFIVILNAEGKIVARVQGEPTKARIEEVSAAVRSLR